MHPKVCQAFGAIYVRVLFALSWLFVCKLSIKDGSTASDANQPRLWQFMYWPGQSYGAVMAWPTRNSSSCHWGLGGIPGSALGEKRGSKKREHLQITFKISTLLQSSKTIFWPYFINLKRLIYFGIAQNLYCSMLNLI